jgi:hypothetical protein
MPRPFGEALHAVKPKEVFYFDYLYVGPSDTNDQYLLILKDDLSGYVCILPSPRADAETTADTLIRWFASFGVVRTWVSDQRSHFKNKTVAAAHCYEPPCDGHVCDRLRGPTDAQ